MADRDEHREHEWADRHFWEIQPIRDLLLLAAVFGVLYLGYLASIVTVPLLFAVLVAYLFEPLVRWLTRWEQLSRQGVAAGIIAVSVLVVLVPLSLVITIGARQGLDLVAALERDITRVAAAYDNTPTTATEPDYSAGVPNGFWKRVSDELIELKIEAALIEEETRSGGEDDAGAAGVEPEGSGDGGAVSEGGEGEVVGGDAGAAAAAVEDDGSLAGVEEGEGELLEGEDGAVETTPREARRARLLITGYQRVKEWVDENGVGLSQRVADVGANAAGWLIGGVTSLGVVGFQAFLTAFFFFFICTGWGKVLEFWEQLIPERKKGEVVDLVRQMDRVVSGFVRGRLTIMVIQCVVFSIGYTLIGVPAGIFVGIGVGVLSVVPYLALVGIPLSLGLILSAGPVEGFRAALWWQVGAPVAFYFVGQALDDYIWTPLIQGKSTDLDTPTVLFASIAGGALAGVYGLLIAIPVAACIKILVRELLWPRLMAWAAGRRPDPLPIGRRGEEDGGGGAVG